MADIFISYSKGFHAELSPNLGDVKGQAAAA
jgi:hypothetical protein